MYNISFEGVLALKRAGALDVSNSILRSPSVSTFRTVYFARLRNVETEEAEYSHRNVETTPALFRANTPSKKIL